MNASGGKIILFVEDDPVVQAAYRHGLESGGFHIEAAMDGIEAMRKLALFSPDVIILDLMLPKFNGVEVLKFMRKTPRLSAVPVIVLSTNSIIDGASEQLLETAHTRLIKDNCTPSVILEAVTKAVGSSGNASNKDDGSSSIRF
jgi:CheY-like chemotaxis protein